MDWFMDSLARGGFEVENPFTHRLNTVPVTPANTHSLVFWSKNIGPFLDGGYGPRLEAMGYHLFFNITLNSEDRLLEPHVPPLARRLDQLRRLADDHDPRSVTWRFDPICHYRDAQGRTKNNLGDVRHIADQAAGAGISRCITSFADLYPKVLTRAGKDRPIRQWIDPPFEQKMDIILTMEAFLAERAIDLFLCCEQDLVDRLPAGSRVRASACIPGDLLTDLFGGTVSRAADSGQRKSQGCRCVRSRDIGSYRRQPCFHDCLFCYANPRDPSEMRP
ncbi:DUF1848 domain-containing protein [Desulfatiferula olefinivorans]